MRHTLVQKTDCQDAPWELPSPAIALVHSAHILPIPLLRTAIFNTLNDVPVALLALVVPLNHEVRQIGDECSTETTGPG